MILAGRSIDTGHIPQHKFKSNFLDYYEDFITKNSSQGNRHLISSFNSFKKFVGASYLSPIEVNENFCERFRKYLLDRLNGETPANYFSRFKRVLEAAKRDSYFKTSPAEGIAAKTKPNKRVKYILDASEYLQLMNTPCLNYEIKKAFVFSLYTGFRWADVKPLTWEYKKGRTGSDNSKKDR